MGEKSNIPDTSREAAESLEPEMIREIYQRILWALTQIKEGTYEDIAKALKIDASKVWKRLSEMNNLKLIYRTENKKELSSGRKGYTWKATLKGSPSIQDHSKAIGQISKEVKKYKTQTLF